MRQFLYFTAIMTGCACAPLCAGDWTAFRGPDGAGVSDGNGFAAKWAPQQNIKWRKELPSPANSSPIVSNGRVFVTCATNQGRQRGLYCFDRESGKRLWVRTVGIDMITETHKTNPYCGSTPVADGTRVVVWHGSAGLHCYDFEGKVIWSKRLGRVGHMWGYGSSPILFQDKVILNFGPGEESFVAAYSLEDGEEIWKTDEPGGTNDRSGRLVGSWSTPQVVDIDGDTQVICSMPTRVVAYHPDTGEIIWYCEGLSGPKGDLVYTSAVVGEGICIAMGGYNGPAIGLKTGGSGDVTDTNRLWRTEERIPQRIGTGVLIGNHLFVANAGPGTAQCIEAATGEVIWEARLPGGNQWGALVLAGGLLYVTNQEGTTHVIEPDPNELKLISSNPLREECNSTPAFSNGQIFLRTYKALYCIEAQ